MFGVIWSIYLRYLFYKFLYQPFFFGEYRARGKAQGPNKQKTEKQKGKRKARSDGRNQTQRQTREVHLRRIHTPQIADSKPITEQQSSH